MAVTNYNSFNPPHKCGIRWQYIVFSILCRHYFTSLTTSVSKEIIQANSCTLFLKIYH